MSYHRKNLNLQYQNGAELNKLNVYLEGSKTVLKGTGPIELATAANVCITGGVAGDCLDVVSSINLNSTNISTETSSRISSIDLEEATRSTAIENEVLNRSTAISTETANRVLAVNDAKNELSLEISTETSSRISSIDLEEAARSTAIDNEVLNRSTAISTETANREDAISSLSAEVSTNKKGGDDNESELSLQISTAQSSINGILDGSNINLNSFSEIVAAYENADSGLQEFINNLTSRLFSVENVLNALTTTTPGLQTLFQNAYNGLYGLFNIKIIKLNTDGTVDNSTSEYLYMENGNNLTVYARNDGGGSAFGVNHEDNDVSPDEHIWKVEKTGPNTYTIQNTAYTSQYLGQFGSVSGSTSGVVANTPPQLVITEDNNTNTTDTYHMSLKGTTQEYETYWYTTNDINFYIDFNGLNNINYNGEKTSFRFEPISSA